MGSSRMGSSGKALLVALPLLAAVIAGCAAGGGSSTDAAGGGAAGGGATSSTVAPGTRPTTTLATTTTVSDEDAAVEAKDFKNLKDMRKVRGMFIDNVLGHLDEAVAVAENPNGGTFPVGTIVQLVPQEAMVKRKAGFSPAFGDWEWFTLDTPPTGTVITGRGGAEVVNRFNHTSCAACHVKSDIKFDFICEKTHGCDPLNVPDSVFIALQEADNRPRTAGP